MRSTHGSCMMNMVINFLDIKKIHLGNLFLLHHFQSIVKHFMYLKFLKENFYSLMRIGFHQFFICFLKQLSNSTFKFLNRLKGQIRLQSLVWNKYTIFLFYIYSYHQLWQFLFITFFIPINAIFSILIIHDKIINMIVQ